MKLKLVTILTLSLLGMQVHADPATQPVQLATTASSTTSTQDPNMKNKQAGEAFLKTNKTKAGVVTLPDGLQYKIITEGKGPKPTETDIVKVEYAGKLIDGTEFDSSSKHGGPIEFPLGQVIPGWVEALKLMPTGSTWEVYIPSELAYGENGAPPTIAPNSTLIFTIKLIDMKKNS
jgi:FKBP-type peptidyl-prolyl cis-trans isomerase